MGFRDPRWRGMRLSAWVGCAFSVVVVAACGPSPDDLPTSDAAVDANDAGLTIAPPTPPDIPWLDEGAPPIAPPMLAPCPEGWHEVVEEGPAGDPRVVTCDPYGATPGGAAPDDCPEGWAHFVGDASCTPVGAPCPAGDFPEGLPTDATVLFVLSSASPGGDGSRGSPLASITEAITRASPGTVIAIGKGVYDEALRLPPRVTLWGACAAETRVITSSPGPSDGAVITIASRDTHLANLRIGPADFAGVVVYGTGASASVDGVLIEGTREYGLYVVSRAHVSGRELVVSDIRPDGAGVLGRGIAVELASSVDLSRVLLAQSHDLGLFAYGDGTSLAITDLGVRDTLARELDGLGGRGLSAQEGATVTISRALFADNRDVGIMVDGGGTSVTLSDVVIRDTQARAGDDGRGWGLLVQEGAAVTLRRGELSRNHEIGILADDEGTSLTLSDVVVRDTLARQSNGADGRGLSVQEGAAATVSRSVFARNRVIGVLADGVATSLTLSDVVVCDTLPQESDGAQGVGLSLQAGVTATVTRATLARNHTTGVLVTHSGTSLTLSDVVVRDTQAQASDGWGGRALGVQDGAAVTVERGLLDANRDVAVHGSGDGTSLTLSDVVVSNTQAQESDGTAGRGLEFQEGIMVTVSRAVLSRNRELGVFADGVGTSLMLSDLVVRDTRERENDGAGGRGISMQAGATATVTRAVVSRNREVGVGAFGRDTSVELFDVVVTDTFEQVCAATTCADFPFGMGLVAVANGSLAATRFEVMNSVLCGVMLGGNGQLDLSMGEVSGSPIGVCLQVEGYSVPRLTNGVRYIGNDSNLDATTLPVPAPAGLSGDAP